MTVPTPPRRRKLEVIMGRLKALSTFDWIALVAFIGSVAFRLSCKFLADDSDAYNVAETAGVMLGLVALLWLVVRVVQSITPPLYRKP
jgi:hypothetical protein